MSAGTQPPRRQDPVRPGERRLRAAVKTLRVSKTLSVSARDGARREDPQPYDDDWGWWIERRLRRIESQIKWLLGLAAAALLAEVIRVALAALGLP